MSIVSSKLPLLNKGRQKVQDVGLRPTRVFICKRVFASATGNGSYTDTRTEILPRPLVSEVGGLIGQGNGRFVVERITPDFGTGGWSLTDLHPAQPPGTLVWFELDGPMGRLRQARAVDIDVTSAFNIKISLEDRQ